MKKELSPINTKIADAATHFNFYPTPGEAGNYLMKKLKRDASTPVPPVLPSKGNGRKSKRSRKDAKTLTKKQSKNAASIFCPQCHSSIDAANSHSMLICTSCGWTYSKRNKELAKKIDRNFQRWSYGISLSLVLGFIQCINWDTYSLQIIPLKAKVLLKVATPSDISQIIKICSELKKDNCLNEAYAKMLQLTPNDTKNLAAYGNFLIREKSDEEALPIFQNYFRAGGAGVDEAFAYAQLLNRSNKMDEAKSYFKYVLKSESSILRIKAIREYIQLLISSKDFKLAKKVLLKFQGEHKRNNLFMTKELKKINKILGIQGSVG